MIETTVVVLAPTLIGSWERWRGECPCGWRGEGRLTQHVARGDALDHERGCVTLVPVELVLFAA